MKTFSHRRRSLTVLLLVFQLSLAPLYAQTSTGVATTGAVTAQQQSAVAAQELDELLGAGSYAFYAEMRFAELSRQAQQNADLFAAFRSLSEQSKLSMPPALLEFSRKYESEWQREDARLILGALALRGELPHLLGAVRLSSPEVAESFAADLKPLIASLKDELTKSARQVTNSSRGTRRTRRNRPTSPAPVPNFLANLNFAVERRGNLVVVSEKPFDFAKLRPAGAPAFVADERVRAARERFVQDGVVYFVDVAGLIEGVPQLIKMMDELTARSAKPAGAQSAAGASLSSVIAPETLKMILNGLRDNFPSAMGAGVKFENGDYVAKALVMPRPGQEASLTPILPLPVMGPALRMRVPQMLPADVTLAASVSLDFQKSYDKALELYSIFTRLRAGATATGTTPGDTAAVEAQIAGLEDLLGLKIRDELLASVGHEVGFALKIKSYPWEQTAPAAGKGPGSNLNLNDYQLALLLEVKDKDRVQGLLTKMLGGAAANRVEEQLGDVTITSDGKSAYAFVGDFLVVSDRAEMIRRIVETQDKGAALAGDADYRASFAGSEALTHVYVAKDLMRSLDVAFRRSVETAQAKKGAAADGKLLALLADMRREPRPAAYLMTTEPAGVYHEARIPTGFYTLLVAYALAESEKTTGAATAPKAGRKKSTSATAGRRRR